MNNQFEYQGRLINFRYKYLGKNGNKSLWLKYSQIVTSQKWFFVDSRLIENDADRVDILIAFNDIDFRN